MPGDPQGPQVQITIVNGALNVSPDPARPSKGQNQQVLWQNKTGQNGVTVSFAAGSNPFAPNNNWSINNNATQASGPITVAAGSTSYKYTVRLSGFPDLDPNVIVDP
jgi:hypothetical protein